MNNRFKLMAVLWALGLLVLQGCQIKSNLIYNNDNLLNFFRRLKFRKIHYK